MDDTAFTHVTHKKGRPAQRNRKGKSTKFQERSVAERVLARKSALDESGYIEQCKVLLRSALDSSAGPSSACPPPNCFVCLGLGSIAASSKSQDQYHLLRGLIEELGDALSASPQIYDPVFDEQDYEFLAEEGMRPLRSEHDLLFSQATLLFMPHCPRSLTELLLRRNWSRENLSKLVIIGNRLDMYEDPTHPSASTKANSPCISKAATVFQIVPLPTNKRHVDAFNDLALQWADPALLASSSPKFWHIEDDTDGQEIHDEEADPRTWQPQSQVPSEEKKRRDQLERDLLAALSQVTI